MKLPILISLIASVFVSPLAAAEKLEDFLGLKFGSTRTAAKKEMSERGSRLKDERTADVLVFSEGTYAGERITELSLHFSGGRFDLATVTVKFSVNKSPERGLEFYETIRKSLTEKYGAPTTSPSIARGKNFAEKAKDNRLETTWDFNDTLKKEHRRIMVSVPEMGMYDWVFKIVYQDLSAGDSSKLTPVRKDI